MKAEKTKIFEGTHLSTAQQYGLNCTHTHTHTQFSEPQTFDLDLSKSYFVRYVERNLQRSLRTNIYFAYLHCLYDQLIIVYGGYEKFCFRVNGELEDCLLCPCR